MRNFSIAVFVLAIGSVPAVFSAQPEDPNVINLVCEVGENRPTMDGKPAGPDEVKFTVHLKQRRVELLNQDGTIVASDANARISTRVIQWGRGYRGLHTINAVTDFDGTIDRETGTGEADWRDPMKARHNWPFSSFKGRCRLISKPKF